MSLTEENEDAVAQRDEHEALASIYGDALLPSEDQSVFNIQIDSDTSLKVILPTDYPSRSPPQYELNAPLMRGEPRLRVEAELDELYVANLGMPIVYLWVEAIRECIRSLREERGSGSQENVDEMMKERGSSFERDVEIASRTISCPEILSGSIIEDRKSVFQGHYACVKSLGEVSLVLNKLMENKKIANATHNIHAYRIRTFSKKKSGEGVLMHDCDDDGEAHAGSRLLHLLELMGTEDILVVVSRWYGGTLLGPDRFKHINNAARDVLTKAGVTRPSATSSNPKK